MIEQSLDQMLEKRLKNNRQRASLALKAAISKATSRDCWYNAWEHKGVRADYSGLEEPLKSFLGIAELKDIQMMCAFLMAKAKRQIERSHDDGDCASQARYWMQHLVKAAIKVGGDGPEIPLWAVRIGDKDTYALTDAVAIVWEGAKEYPRQTWSRVADELRNNNSLYLRALGKAGRDEERLAAEKECFESTGNCEGLVKTLLDRGRIAEASAICKKVCAKYLKRGSYGSWMLATYRRILVAQGHCADVAKLDEEMFRADPSESSYIDMIDSAITVGDVAAVRNRAYEFLVSRQKFSLLVRLALSEHRIDDAIKYYREYAAVTAKDRFYWNRNNCDFDWEVADRIARHNPAEAEWMWKQIIATNDRPDQAAYRNIGRALENLKGVMLASGRTKDWRELCDSLRAKYPKRINLLEIIRHCK